MKLIENADGTYTVQGGGWFWVSFNARGEMLKIAEGMRDKPAHRDFLKRAQKFFLQQKLGIS